MANKTGQEKREGLRLDLNQDLIGASGLALNTPDLDKACEMALPTPVLNKKVLDMYGPPKAEPVIPQQPQLEVQAAPQNHIPAPTSAPVAATAAVKPFQAQTYTQPVGHSQPIIILPASTRLQAPLPSHSRMGPSSANIVVAPNLPVAPLDPSEQERLKMDRKRERNRAAAQRCREKKIARIEALSKDVEELENQKAELVNTLKTLEQSAQQTVRNVEEHRRAGCDLDNNEINKLVHEASELQKVITIHLSQLSARVIPTTTGYDDSSSEQE